MAAENRILVSGAGLAGLAAASSLRAAGLQTTVYERATELLPAGAVVSVMANAAAGLERAGLGKLIEEVCVPVQKLDYLDWKGRYLAHMPISEVAETLGTKAYITLRSDMQLGMYERLGPEVVQLGATCAGFTQDDEGVTLRLEDGREERGAALIGADGIRSMVREQLLGDEPRYAGYSGWRGLATMAKPPLEPGFGKQVGGRGRTWGAFALRGNRVYWFSSAKMEQGLGDSAAGRKNDVRETFAGAPDWVLEVIEATPEEEILRHDIFDRQPVKRWGEGRVTMIGDAAHATTPNTGQGGSHALLDGVIVGEKLASIAASLKDASAVRGVFEQYENERIPQTSKVVKEAGMVGTMVHFKNPLLCLIRDRILYKRTPKRTWRKRASAYLEAGKAAS
jgi:2-polyprenyl-6-methoxyphenol hydroxylase-like FAD-dependent oxidoreductase